MKNYNLIQSSREKVGGGVAIYLNKSITYRELEQNELNNINVARVEFKHDNTWKKLIAFYKPPQNNIDELLKIIAPDLDSDQPTILCGDSNINCLDNTFSSRKYIQTMSSNGFYFNNNQITRPSSNTIIDQIITKNVEIDTCATIETPLSDHNIIIAKINQLKNLSTKQTITKSPIDEDTLIKEFQININHLRQLNDPNEQLELLTNCITSATEKATKTTVYKIKSEERISPWITNDILKLLKRKGNLSIKIRKLKKRKKPTSHLQNLIEIITQKIENKTYDNTLRHYAKIFKENEAKSTWNTINEVIGKKNKKDKIILVENDEKIDDEQKVTEILNDYFTSITNSQQNANFGNYNKYNTINDNCNSFFFSEVDALDVSEAIKRINPSKATGYDGVKPKVLKQLFSKLVEPLLIIINTIISTKKFPDQLKKANITALYKGVGDKTNKSNYRPIAVLSSISKIIEWIFKNKIDKFLQKNKLLDNNQLGFKNKVGADTALIEFVTELANEVDKGKIVVAIFFDIAKAFDTIKHDVLLKKMEHYGFRGHSNDLIKSYFTNRTQAVKINNKLSSYKMLINGIGQGSVQGPQYFNLKLLDFKNLPLKGRTKRFADDVVVYASFDPKSTNEDSILYQIRHDIELVQDYHDINGLSINPNKTKFMIFKQKQLKYKMDDKIETTRKDIIHKVTDHKYLGLVIDENLTFETHINKVIEKILPAVNILAKLKHYLPSHILLNIYYAHVHSHLNYVSSLYGTAKKSLINEIQTLQSRALKHVYKLPYHFNTQNLFKNYASNILPVRGIVCANALTFIYKITKLKYPSNLIIEVSNKGLRNDGQLIPKICQTELMRRNPAYYAVIQFNSLPEDVKSTCELSGFKRKLKNNLLVSANKFIEAKHIKFENILKTLE